MIVPKRATPLQDPLEDPELEPVGPPDGVTVTQATADLEEGQQLTAKTIAAVGQYIDKLPGEQSWLLQIALRHARDSKAHAGQVLFYKRRMVYAGDWGLEVIDKVGTGGEQVTPLVLVFVEPP